MIDTDTTRTALTHLQARRRTVLDVLKGWPPETLGCDAWLARMDELARINRQLGRVFEELED